MTEEYTVFGAEWKEEVSKWRKDFLIEQYRNQLIRSSEHKSRIEELEEKLFEVKEELEKLTIHTVDDAPLRVNMIKQSDIESILKKLQ